MKIAAILLSFLILSSCLTYNHVAITHNALYEVSGGLRQSMGIFDEEDVAKFTDRFLELWVEQRLPGDIAEIKAGFSTIDIHWQQTVFVYQSFGLGSPRLLGLACPGKERFNIYAYDSSQTKDPKLGKTSLAHEYVHAALYFGTGNIHSKHVNRPDKNEWGGRYLRLINKLNSEFM